MERKNYLDNIRWITVVIVMLYHVVYMTHANFGYYALHYFVLVAIIFALEKITYLPIRSCYLISTFGMIALTTLLYLIISRIPFIRKILLGMK